MFSINLNKPILPAVIYGSHKVWPKESVFQPSKKYTRSHFKPIYPSRFITTDKPNKDEVDKAIINITSFLENTIKENVNYCMNKRKNFAVNDTNWGHRWGYKDSVLVSKQKKAVTLSETDMNMFKKSPNLIPFAEEMLDIEILPKPRIKEVEKIYFREKINKDFMDEPVSVFDEDRYCSTDEERLLHSHGQTTSDEVYKVLYSKLDSFIDLVFYIESENEQRN